MFCTASHDRGEYQADRACGRDSFRPLIRTRDRDAFIAAYRLLFGLSAQEALRFMLLFEREL